MQTASATNVAFGKACREICEWSCIIGSGCIGGPGIVVEIDETKVGKRKYNKWVTTYNYKGMKVSNN